MKTKWIWGYPNNSKRKWFGEASRFAYWGYELRMPWKFKIINIQCKTKQKKSVPWWTDSLTIMRKRINALKWLHLWTRNNEELRKNRKHKNPEEKKMYYYEIRREKLNSWKENCNMTASLNPWTHEYKLATKEVRTSIIIIHCGNLTTH